MTEQSSNLWRSVIMRGASYSWNGSTTHSRESLTDYKIYDATDSTNGVTNTIHEYKRQCNLGIKEKFRTTIDEKLRSKPDELVTGEIVHIGDGEYALFITKVKHLNHSMALVHQGRGVTKLVPSNLVSSVPEVYGSTFSERSRMHKKMKTVKRKARQARLKKAREEYRRRRSGDNG